MVDLGLADVAISLVVDSLLESDLREYPGSTIKIRRERE